MNNAMNKNRISGSQVQVVHEETINAPVEDLFPLACPVLEYRWIPGWKCELVHCPKGRVEKGTVFNEIMSAPVLTGSPCAKTTWTAVLHDPAGHRVHYRLENRVSTSLNRIEMRTAGPGVTVLRFDFTYEAKNEKGERIIGNNGPEKIGLMLALLAGMLKYYAEQGEIPGAMYIKKKAIRFTHFSAGDKFNLMLNELAMKVMRDENRKKFLRGEPVSVRREP